MLSILQLLVIYGTSIHNCTVIFYSLNVLTALRKEKKQKLLNYMILDPQKENAHDDPNDHKVQENG